MTGAGTLNTASGAARKHAGGATGAKDMPWEPRIWTGMDAVSWFRVLARHRFSISPTRMPMVLSQCIIGTGIYPLIWASSLLDRRRISRTEIHEAPLFILGHWRTGTTFLQELLALDERHASPTTYECFGPNHFLTSERFVKGWLSYLMPRRRPMDNVAVGLDRPQEDEFALCGLGVGSPYLDWAFPNGPARYDDYLDLRNLPPAERERWKAALLWFLKSLECKHPGKRIVLKSPTHSYRVRTLLEMFPNARFVNIVRDPQAVIPSTLHMWKKMTTYHGAQVPRNDLLKEQVFHRFDRLCSVLAEDRELIAPGRFCEVRYEDLVADPAEEVREIYSRLDLGSFEPVQSKLDGYVESLSGYRTNSYSNSPELEAEINTRCAKYMEQYGYSTDGHQVAAADASAISGHQGA